jgi:hypothetical protein
LKVLIGVKDSTTQCDILSRKIMPRLKVLMIADRDVYKDIVRIPEIHRVDRNGNIIEEATICWIRGTPKKSVVTLRGFQRSSAPEIRMDERTRLRLGVDSGESYDFEFKHAGMWGQLKWAWRASETGYQVASRLAVIGLVLGILAFLPVLHDWLIWLCERVRSIL